MGCARFVGALFVFIKQNNYKTIISSFKLNISMSMIGVISGEFLVSQKGLGYLIIYGTQVFNLDLVISGIILLSVFLLALKPHAMLLSVTGALFPSPFSCA